MPAVLLQALPALLDSRQEVCHRRQPVLLLDGQVLDGLEDLLLVRVLGVEPGVVPHHQLLEGVAAAGQELVGLALQGGRGEDGRLVLQPGGLEEQEVNIA